jgi:hypothetical protein
VPVALAAGLAGAGVASLLAGGKKRVYGKGLAQFLPNDASSLAKNIRSAGDSPRPPLPRAAGRQPAACARRLAALSAAPRAGPAAITRSSAPPPRA